MAVERESPTWRAVKAHCEKAIEKARDQLETPLSGEPTDLLRGQIAALRGVLAIAEVKPEISSSDTLY